MRVIKGKLKGKKPRLKEAATPQQAEVVDLMARLRASLEGAGERRNLHAAHTASKHKAAVAARRARRSGSVKGRPAMQHC